VRATIVLVAMLLAGLASAQSPDISARRLPSSWKGDDPSRRLVAEVIASAFSSGLSWRGSLAGKEVYGTGNPLEKTANSSHIARRRGGIRRMSIKAGKTAWSAN
jgi:hypothetical protein